MKATLATEACEGECRLIRERVVIGAPFSSRSHAHPRRTTTAAFNQSDRRHWITHPGKSTRHLTPRSLEGARNVTDPRSRFFGDLEGSPPALLESCHRLSRTRADDRSSILALSKGRVSGEGRTSHNDLPAMVPVLVLQLLAALHSFQKSSMARPTLAACVWAAV